MPKDGEKTVYGFRDDMIDVDDYFVGVVAGDGDKGFSMALTRCMADLCSHISHQNLVPFSKHVDDCMGIGQKESLSNPLLATAQTCLVARG